MTILQSPFRLFCFVASFSAIVAYSVEEKIFFRQGADDCSSGYFKCDGVCVSDHWLCDGILDCKDEIDEKGCEDNTTVTENHPAIIPSTGEGNKNYRNENQGIISNSHKCNKDLCSACFFEERSTALKCPKDFEFFDGTCIWVNVFPKTWKSAKDSCKSRNSHLAEFTSDSLFSLSTVLQQRFGKDGWNYWVGQIKEMNVDVVSKDMEIPSWFLNGQKTKGPKSHSGQGECYFLDQKFDFYLGLHCSDYAGFICQTSAKN